MGEIKRAFLNLVVSELSASRTFYERLGYTVRFASDWFVHLAAPDADAIELGLLLRAHDVVPRAAQAEPAGVLLTVVVPDVDAVYATLRDAGVDVLEEPRDLFYGQRRLLVRAPEGTIVDVSSECAPDPQWLAKVRQAPDGSHVEGG